MSPLWLKLKNIFLDILFPPLCLSCQKYLLDSSDFICPDCLASLTLNSSPLCPVCGLRQPNKHLSCHHSPPFTLLAATGFHHSPAAALVHALKFKKLIPVGHLITDLLLIFLTKAQVSFSENTLVIPIPLSLTRRTERGFNQAEILAEAIAKHFTLNYRPDLLYRRHHTLPQAKLKKSSRLTNVTNCFALRSFAPAIIKSRSILLIDDVFTTGATVTAAVKILKQAGATDITVLVFAKT